MYRQSPLNSSFFAYTSGGTRALVDEISDNPMMQEMKGSFMQGEAREKIESPQNYGFTSVCMPAKKGKDGKIEECAEAYINFLGGNRSFPVAAVMDDRRFRLKELKPGDVAVFDHLQHQLHFNKDGMFMTGRTDKKLKFQLFDPPQDDQQSGSGKSATTTASSTDSSSSSGGGNRKKGQKQRYDKEGKQFLEMTKDKTNLVHDQTIEHKTPLHSFQPGSGAAAKAGGPLVQIFGDKFTGGLGHFMKQVTAAPPSSSMHLTTKGYVDSIFSALGIPIPALPSLPMPPLPPGVTLPPGITLPTAEKVSTGYKPSQPKLFEVMEARLAALERRVAELESKINA
ncbi:phage baseplate assembly protein [Bradyrhizobium sp. SRL28]|uniref:phage baseplate assembly protein domain-containing protein n=1 Tax=Bradyrhizobium sp. SRL28 TaxID=2836178 RepID=UPI001BDDF217|nr:phage baseplate assembly protein [Bradyrhizobium sp. SRL28]MBT1509400.1 phage baseplate assembly protein [Bradyrhizobium sp. SRL28]